MTKKTIEERVEVLERKTVPDTSGMSDQQIAQLKAAGIVPVGEAPANPMQRGMEMMAAMQFAMNLPPLTPEEALSRYNAGAPSEVALFAQPVLLIDNEDHRRTLYEKGWHLIPQRFVQRVAGYCGSEAAPNSLIAQLLEIKG